MIHIKRSYKISIRITEKNVSHLSMLVKLMIIHQKIIF